MAYVPTKREQSGACSGYAERAALRPRGNVPTLRFPGFTDEWQKMRLDELLDFYSTNSLSWEQLEYDNGDLYNLHYGLIHVGLPTLVDFTAQSLPFIKDAFMPRNYELVKEGDIAFADASEDTNEVAKAVEFTNTAKNRIVCGLHTIHARDNRNRTVVGFKGFYFSSTAFLNQVRRLAQGTKIFSVSTKTLSECFVSLPSKDEQSKIASLMKLIDERIALQSKLIEDLKKLKSAISKHLLSDKALLELTVPLSEVCGLKNGYAFKSSTYCNNGKFSIITIANIQGNRYITETGCNTINHLPTDIQNHQILNENDILISMTGNVGRVSLCKKGNYLLNQRVGLLSPFIEEVEFLFQVLSSEKFGKDMVSCSQGAAQLNIGRNDIGEYMIPYSNNSKNLQRIGNILLAYDQSIDLNIKILDNLISQKQFLLSAMFI